MPPHRSLPPVKPVVIERTHEENQERAYIAASRRTDRSLEARVESARRASEIHKQRTGRALRITEEDVVNSEVYEEEIEDDLPAPYRHLTAHLQTGSAGFNRRLSAYLTNHVAVRSALEQAINASYAQYFPNAPRFAHSNPTFPSPMLAHGGASSAQLTSPQSPHQYRQSPYPMPGSPAYRSNTHRRSESIAADSELTPSAKVETEKQPLVQRRPSTSASKPFLSGSAGESDSAPTSNEHGLPGDPSMSEGFQIDSSFFSPFSSSLSFDAQQLLGPALDSADPFTASLMSGSDGLPMPSYGNMFYNYMAKDIEKSQNKGATPAIEPLALKLPQNLGTKKKVDLPFATPSKTTGLEENIDDTLDTEKLADSLEFSSAIDSGEADAAWDDFIDENVWVEGET